MISNLEQETRISGPNATPYEIAIIGIGCRFPGGADSPAAFWELLCNGQDAIREVPSDRWHTTRFYDPAFDTPATAQTRWGGFLDQIDRFDPAFFGISPREAIHIDPQQRLLLETSWEAFEDAGQNTAKLSRSVTGVFIGISTGEYWDLQLSSSNRSRIDAYTNLGGSMSIAANRISYIFDLHGPSMAVDTACSSSLVAAHLACGALRTGECDMAVVGGVNAILKPEVTIGFSKAQMLSPDGRCKAFDEQANGYVRGEGAGVVILKPLRRALQDNDRIYAIIKGSAVNQDGRSSGITVPVAEAQQAMLKTAYRNAGIRPCQVHYVEAHGTGTPVGDPIEATALGAVLSEGREKETVCYIGSVKTNIGHLESAAGIAGLIKAALAINYRQIPANLHFQRPNLKIDFKGLKLSVPTRLMPWPDAPEAVAGVNSFGFGGTNAHVVITEPPLMRQAAQRDVTEAQLVLVSARNQDSLKIRAQAYADYVSGSVDVGLPSIAYSSSERSSSHQQRLAIITRNTDELTRALLSFVAGAADTGSIAGFCESTSAPRVAFVFTGMGPQWWGMGRDLLQHEPIYRHAVEECAALFHDYAGWSLLDEMLADLSDARMGETRISQPANFALQVGLSALLESWGISPSYIVGHSTGEVAAAYVSGMLSLEDAVRVIFYRSSLQQRMTGTGKMAAVGLPEEYARAKIADWADRVMIAAVNSPRSVTLSGEAAALKEVQDVLEAEQVFFRFLQVDIPYHSAKMDPLRNDLLASLREIDPRPPRVSVFSAVTGNVEEAFDAEYWWRNVREPVLFSQCMRRLLDHHVTVFLEIGPHPVLSNAIRECAKAIGKTPLILPTLRRHESDRENLLSTVARLWIEGSEPHWANLFKDKPQVVALPGHPWQRERYWDESTESALDRIAPAAHPLLGARLAGPLARWENDIAAKHPEFLCDHRVRGSVVVPGCAYLEMGVAACLARRPDDLPAVENVRFEKALFLNDQQWERITLEVDLQGGFTIHAKQAQDGTEWTLHARGELKAKSTQCRLNIAELDTERERCGTAISTVEFYRRLEDIGLDYGGQFKAVAAIRKGVDCAVGEFNFSDEVAQQRTSYIIHPAALDNCLQVLIATFPGFERGALKNLYLPIEVGEFSVLRPFALPRSVFAKLSHATDNQIIGDLTVFAADGSVSAILEGLVCRAVGDRESAVHSIMRNRLVEYRWMPQLRKHVAHGVRSLMAISPSLQADTAALSHVYRRAIYYREVEPSLAAVSVQYIHQAFSRFGLLWRAHETLTPQMLIERHNVKPRFDRLCIRLLKILSQNGILVDDGDGSWRVQQQCPIACEPRELIRELQSGFPEFTHEIDLVQRCGENLAQVLAGNVDSLELLFPGGDLNNMAAFYSGSPSFRLYNEVVAHGLQKVFGDEAKTARLQLIELGAGTGGLTSCLLPIIAAFDTEYTFTDISPNFLTFAQGRFHEAFLRYKRLDIEQAPGAQGFAPRGYDVVLASDVFHATKDPGAVLENVKRLLKPGGLLAFVETTKPTEWVDLVFGLTEGWWRFEDVDRQKKGHPLLDPSEWRELLSQHGFSDVIALSDSVQECQSLQTVFLARHVPNGSLPTTKRPPSYIVLSDRVGFGERLRQKLKDETQTVIAAVSGTQFRNTSSDTVELDVQSIADFQRLLQCEPRNRDLEIIHLLSLDSTSVSSPSTAYLAAAQSYILGSALRLVQAIVIANITRAVKLCFVTCNAGQIFAAEASGLSQSPLWGFVRTIRAEYPQLNCVLIDLPHVDEECVSSLMDEILIRDSEENEIAYDQKHKRCVHRLVSLPAQEYFERSSNRVPGKTDRLVTLKISQAGDLESLGFKEAAEMPLGSNEIRVRVRAAGLNFKDVMLAMGLLDDRAAIDTYCGSALGMECAGNVIALGANVLDLALDDEVIAVAPSSMSTFVVAQRDYVTRKSRGMPWPEAAGLPVAYLTAYYALRQLAKLQSDEAVLIHSATGGVGLSAIGIARLIGAKIFATAGSEDKRGYLRSIGVEHVFNSRSLEFAQEIRRITGGRGLNVVLNSLSGEAINKSLSILAPYGRFVELGKKDVYENSRIPLFPFRNNISYFVFDLDRLMRDRAGDVSSCLREIMMHLDAGNLQPLPYLSFAAAEAPSAFRYVAQAKHIGKVVLSFSDDRELTVGAPVSSAPDIKSDGTYWITGGSSGFGLAVAEWLVESGARTLVLMSRRGVVDESSARKVEEMQRQGVTIVVAQADVANSEEVALLASRIRKELPPLCGIFHAAMVLDDGMIPNLDLERVTRVLYPKINGAWNLHQATVTDRLDFFVLFSSVVGLLGNAGQASYAAANVFLGALANYRVSCGLPALAVDWGAIRDVGFVSRRTEIAEHLGRQGLKGMPVRQALASLGIALANPHCAQVGILSMDWQQSAKARLDIRDCPTYEELINVSLCPGEISDSNSAALAVHLGEAETDEKKTGLIAEALAQKAAAILSTSKGNLSLQEPLIAQGMDSLMAVELSVWTEAELGLNTPMTDLMKGLSINQLATRLAVHYTSSRENQNGRGLSHAAAVPEAFRKWVLSLAASMRARCEEWKHTPAPKFKNPLQDDYTLPREAQTFCDRLLAASHELSQYVGQLTAEQHIIHRTFYREHLLEFFQRSPLLRRSYEKPLGYPGDFEIMNMIYRRIPEGENLYDVAIDKYAKDEPACRAVVNRIDYICHRLKTDIRSVSNPVTRIANIGCGPARDLERFLLCFPDLGPRLEIVLIDQDDQALADARERLTSLAANTAAKLNFVPESVDRLLDSDIFAALLGQRDIIYSTGLFDYFNDQTFRKLLSIIYGVLPKGGRMYIGNMSTENPTRWLIEYACDWFIFHRTQDEMIRLADQLEPRPELVTVEAEPLGINLFLLVIK